MSRDGEPVEHLSGWTCQECGEFEDNADIQPEICEACGGQFCHECIEREHDDDDGEECLT